MAKPKKEPNPSRGVPDLMRHHWVQVSDPEDPRHGQRGEVEEVNLPAWEKDSYAFLVIFPEPLDGTNGRWFKAGQLIPVPRPQ